MVLLLLPLVLAVEPTPFDKNTFSWNTGTYSEVDWTQLTTSADWENIPIERINEVPTEELKYSLLSDSQKKQLDSAHIAAHIEEIADLSTEVNVENAKAALQEKFGVTVMEFSSGARVESGSLKATSGLQEHLTLSYELYKTGSIKVTDKGEIVFVPLEKVAIEEMPKEDVLTLNLGKITRVSEDPSRVKSEEKPVVTYKGSAMLGRLSFKEGQAYVKAGDEILIEDVLIPKNEQNPVEVYFNPVTPPKGNFVAFSKVGEEVTGMEVGAAPEGKVEVIPQPGNRLFNMVKRKYDRADVSKERLEWSHVPSREDDHTYIAYGYDPATGKYYARHPSTGELGRFDPATQIVYPDSAYPNEFTWVPDERDKISLLVQNGDKVTAISRTDAGMVPLITRSGEGQTKIVTGRDITISFEGKEAYMPPPKGLEGKTGNFDQRGSVPFALTWDGPLKYVLVSSSNRALMVGDKGKIDYTRGMKVTEELEFNQLKTMDDLQVRHPEIIFKIDKTVHYQEITPDMAQLMVEALDATSRSKRKMLENVEFNDEANAAALDGMYTGTIFFGERALDPVLLRELAGAETPLPLGVFNHEFNHLVDNVARSKEMVMSGGGGPPRAETLRAKYASAVVELMKSVAHTPEYQEYLSLSRELHGELEEKKKVVDKQLKELTIERDSLRVELTEKEKQAKSSSSDLSKDQEYSSKVAEHDQIAGQIRELGRTYNSLASLAEELPKSFDGEFEEKDYYKQRAYAKVLNRVADSKLKEYESMARLMNAALERAFPSGGRTEYILNLYPETQQLSFLGYTPEEKKWFEEAEIPDFTEAGTVPLEPSAEKVPMMVLGGNKFARMTTQLGYDSGKISKEEYLQRMGGYCKSNLCGKCLEYKVLCTQE